MSFNRGRNKNDTHSDIMFLDLRNAYNAISRNAVYRGLARYCPELLPWFIWTHRTTSKLITSSGQEVGTCYTGIKQGDPLSALYFAVGIQDTLQAIHDKLREEDPNGHDHTSTNAYADDIKLRGDATKLLNLLPWIKQVVKEDTGLEVVPSKTQLVLSKMRRNYSNIKKN